MVMKKGWIPHRYIVSAAMLGSMGLACAQSLPAHGFMAYAPPPSQKTHLIAIQQGSALSRTVASIRNEVYELDDGSPLYMKDKYKTSWQDLQLTFLTELNPQLGLIWGFGTGERGPKYKIEPSFVLGSTYLKKLDSSSFFNIRLTYRMGGRLKEKPCLTSRPRLGLINTPENCRLTNSILPPEETLKYLLNESPRDRMVFAVRYVKQF